MNKQSFLISSLYNEVITSTYEMPEHLFTKPGLNHHFQLNETPVPSQEDSSCIAVVCYVLVFGFVKGLSGFFFYHFTLYHETNKKIITLQNCSDKIMKESI